MATINATVTVTPATTLKTIDVTSFGVNHATWDPRLTDPSTAALLAKTPVTFLRFPGGSTADFYHPFGPTYRIPGATAGSWVVNPNPDPTQHTATGKSGPGQNGTPLPNQPQFPLGITYNIKDYMDNVVTKLGTAAQVKILFIANYGSNLDGTDGGDPMEAACFALYMKNHYPGYLWGMEIGNENYGGVGEFSVAAPQGGFAWEYNTRAAKGPAVYATQYMLFYNAIKAQDASVKISPFLTAPGNWPDGATPLVGGGQWNPTILAAVGAHMEFATFHVYPQGPKSGGATQEGDANLLASAAAGSSLSPSPAAMYASMRAQLVANCGSNPLGANNIPITLTETNSVSYNPGKQSVSPVNALFAMDWNLTCMEAGYANTCWWAFTNGPQSAPHDQANCDPSLYGDSKIDYGDYGWRATVIDASNPSFVADYPAAGTLFSAAYAYMLMRYHCKTGDHLIACTTDHPLPGSVGNTTGIRPHAAIGADGSLRVTIINPDVSGNSYSCVVNMGTFGATGAATGFSYGGSPTAASLNPVTATVSSGLSSPIVVAPYSMTTMVFQPTGTPVTPSGGGTAANVTLLGTTIAPNPIYPGQTLTITPTITTDTNVTGCLLKVTLTPPGGGAAIPLAPVTIALNANTTPPATFPVTYAVPNTQALGTGGAVQIAVFPATGTTPYLSQDSGQTFTVNQPPFKTQPLQGGGSSKLTPSGGILLSNLVDPITGNPLKQASVTVNTNDKNQGTEAPLVPIMSPQGTTTNVATEDTLQSIFNGLVQNLFAISTGGNFTWLYGLDPIQGGVRTQAGDTGWLDSSGLSSLGLWIDFRSLSGTGGTPQIQFFLDTRMENGSYIQLGHTNNYQNPQSTQQSIYTYLDKALISATTATNWSWDVVMPFTDYVRIRWALSWNGGAGTGLASAFAVNLYGK